MKDNHKTLMKISLALTIVGAGYIKPCVSSGTFCSLSCIKPWWTKVPSQNLVPCASSGLNTSSPSQSPVQPIDETKLEIGLPEDELNVIPYQQGGSSSSNGVLTTSDAETADSVCQTVNITLRNFAGE
jgi:hypothetical protein